MSSDHDWGHNSAVNNEDREGCREMEFCDNNLYYNIHTTMYMAGSKFSISSKAKPGQPQCVES